MITPYHAKYSIDECTILWVCSEPPAGNANYAWVQQFIHHLAPHGMAGFVLAVTASLNHSFYISGFIAVQDSRDRVEAHLI